MQDGYLLKDELGNVGKQIAIRQGEIKTISVYMFDQFGIPANFATVVECLVKISSGGIAKRLTTSSVTMLAGPGGGKMGFSFTLSAADTAAMAASSTIGMSATISDNATPTVINEQDFPNAFLVSTPLVP